MGNDYFHPPRHCLLMALHYRDNEDEVPETEEQTDMFADRTSR